MRFRFLAATAELIGAESVHSLKLELMSLGAADENGRRMPVSTGRYESMDVDCVISAIGQTIDLCGIEEGSAIKLGRKNTILVNPLSYQTDEADVFAGGDAVTGPRFAIDAIAMGKQGDKLLLKEMAFE